MKNIKKQSKKFKEVVINRCFGGFGLSDLAYEELIKLGIPAVKHIKEKRNPKTGLYDMKEKKNEGKVIFDRRLSIGEGFGNDEAHIKSFGRYWECFINKERENPLLIKVVKKLGIKANGNFAELTIIKIPFNVKYIISDYDGMESIEEEHKSWR